MILSVILLAGFFHHKKSAPEKSPVVTHSAEWMEQRKYLDRASAGIKAYEADTQYAQYERPQLDAFEAQLQKCYDEKNSDDKKFIQDMKKLDELGQVLDSLDLD